MNKLLVKAILAFLLLPGVVAFLIPIALLVPGGIQRFDARALVFLIPGSMLLVWCVIEFYMSGKGTLAPWAPPKRLVESGPYRFSRNPMYIAVTLILWGWAAAFKTGGLALYAAGMMVGFHLRVTLVEEPWLASNYGAGWNAYRARVPRWVGLRRTEAPRPDERA